MARLLAAVAVLARPCTASAGLVQRPVQHAGQVKGTNVFVAIVEKPGNRFRAYVSEGQPTRATLSVWFRGDIAEDGSLRATDHGVTLAARIANDNARGAVTLPDGRVLRFAIGSTGLGVRPNPSCEQLRERTTRCCASSAGSSCTRRGSGSSA